MTVQELRTALFDITNQDMTVREVRKMLFDVEDHNAEVTRLLILESCEKNEA